MTPEQMDELYRRIGEDAPMRPLTDDSEQRTLDRLAQVDRRLEEVAAENGRLRAALADIFEHRDRMLLGDNHVYAAARAALAGGGQ